MRLTFEGAQAGGGSLIIRSGGPSVDIITPSVESETHPTELVTVKKYSPPARPLTVILEPELAVVTSSGKRVRIHPSDGNPLITTLPVGTEYVGWVIVPTTGTEGVFG